MDLQKTFTELEAEIGKENFEMFYYQSDKDSITQYSCILLKHHDSGKEYDCNIFDSQIENAVHGLKMLKKDLSK